MRGGLRVVMALTLATAVFSVPGRAAIGYDAARRTISITGYTDERPGTLADVLEGDRQGGWGVVTSNDATQTFAVRAHLSIGAKEGASTWFQIGALERPRETLLIAGDLRVEAPKALEGYLHYANQNVLRIGMDGHPDVTPVVRFQCSRNAEYGLQVGDGATVLVTSATITSTTGDREHLAYCKIGAARVRIQDSGLAWLTGPGGVAWGMVSGLSSVGSPLRRVTFEHGPRGVCNNSQWLEDCIFRDLDCGIEDTGCLDAVLLRCRFEGNRRNWSLGFSDMGILAIDCLFGPEGDPGPHITRWLNPATGRWQRPSFVAQRHIVVQVRDEAGNPVQGAQVEAVESSGDASAVHCGFTKTGADGRTPRPFEYGALRVADYAHAATDDAPEPDSPNCRIASHDYRYTVRVTAEGFKPSAVDAIDPDESCTETAVVLHR